MGVLVLRCHMTGKEFSTGVETPETDIDRLPDVLTTALCPYCKLEHRWWTHEARIAAVVPPSTWVENQSRGRQKPSRKPPQDMRRPVDTLPLSGPVTPDENATGLARINLTVTRTLTAF